MTTSMNSVLVETHKFTKRLTDIDCVYVMHGCSNNNMDNT